MTTASYQIEEITLRMLQQLKKHHHVIKVALIHSD